MLKKQDWKLILKTNLCGLSVAFLCFYRWGPCLKKFKAPLHVPVRLCFHSTAPFHRITAIPMIIHTVSGNKAQRDNNHSTVRGDFLTHQGSGPVGILCCSVCFPTEFYQWESVLKSLGFLFKWKLTQGLFWTWHKNVSVNLSLQNSTGLFLTVL